jgi:DDE superfamily endonuclease
LWWSAKYKHHGGNVQVVSDPDGRPIWVCAVRPGRETRRDLHESRPGTGRRAGAGAAALALRMPAKKPKGGNLTAAQQQDNLAVRGVHAVAERANSLLALWDRPKGGRGRLPPRWVPRHAP